MHSFLVLSLVLHIVHAAIFTHILSEEGSGLAGVLAVLHMAASVGTFTALVAGP